MGERAPIPAPEIGDLAAAAGFRTALLEALKADAPLVIDAAAVRRFGTACVQVLIAADISAQRLGGARRLHIPEPSEAFADALRDLGLDDDLERWSA